MGNEVKYQISGAHTVNVVDSIYLDSPESHWVRKTGYLAFPRRGG
jgi:hypothetical protein